MRSQGTEGTLNLELGRFLLELEDADWKKNEDIGDIILIREEKRRDVDEEKSVHSCNGKKDNGPKGRSRTRSGQLPCLYFSYVQQQLPLRPV